MFYWRIHKSIGTKALPELNSSLSAAEVATILVLFHHSDRDTFKDFYLRDVLGEMKSYFPNAVSYSRFISLLSGFADYMNAILSYNCALKKNSGLFFIDSKKYPVCHSLRRFSNKVFKGFAASGKSSMGWFYGLKVHIVINIYGEIVNFRFTPANISDNNHDLLRELLVTF